MVLCLTVRDRDVLGAFNATIAAAVAVTVVISVTMMMVMIPKVDVEAIIVDMSSSFPREGRRG